MKDQKKSGALISYLNILLSMVSNFVLIPLMIGALSDDEYSIYKVMQSVSGPLIMLNLGISTITARAIAKYKAGDQGDPREKESTLALGLIISCAMAAVVMLLAGVVRALLPTVYGDAYSPRLLEKANRIFMIFAATTAVRIINDTFKGCILGNERFLCFYGESTAQYLLRFCAIVLLLRHGADAVAVAMVDFVICGALLVFNVLYATLRLKERLRLHYVSRRELKSIASFSGAILLQAIVNQVNNNVDLMILGAVAVDKRIITMYSAALSIYAVYNSVLSVFVSIYFPKAARLALRGSSGEELTDFVIGLGRGQAVIAVGILTAFGLFGKHFITVWIGERYLDAYYVAWMLMIPMTIPLVQNGCLAILDARLKRMFRSVILVIMAAVNVVISLVLIRPLGFWGAALGTVLSLLIGHGLLMNLYYHRVIGLNIPRMFREIFRGILPAGILSGILSMPLALLEHTPAMLPVKCAGFVAVYGAMLWLGGWSPAEKSAVRNAVLRRRG